MCVGISSERAITLLWVTPPPFCGWEDKDLRGTQRIDILFVPKKVTMDYGLDTTHTWKSISWEAK